jgi:hypothetical protein
LFKQNVRALGSCMHCSSNLAVEPLPRSMRRAIQRAAMQAQAAGSRSAAQRRVGVGQLASVRHRCSLLRSTAMAETAGKPIECLGAVAWEAKKPLDVRKVRCQCLDKHAQGPQNFCC